MQVFQKSKSAILGIMTELKIIPTLDFEKLVVCEEDTAFKPTKENMNALRVCSFTVSVLICVVLNLRTLFLWLLFLI
jgi:hypothetical protein